VVRGGGEQAGLHGGRRGGQVSGADFRPVDAVGGVVTGDRAGEAAAPASPAFLSAEDLLEQVWDEHASPFTNTVTVTIGRLRRKLADPPAITHHARRGLPHPSLALDGQVLGERLLDLGGNGKPDRQRGHLGILPVGLVPGDQPRVDI
jgi:Transcriptional regulatory protein, C terminal